MNEICIFLLLQSLQSADWSADQIVLKHPKIRKKCYYLRSFHIAGPKDKIQMIFESFFELSKMKKKRVKIFFHKTLILDFRGNCVSCNTNRTALFFHYVQRVCCKNFQNYLCISHFEMDLNQCEKPKRLVAINCASQRFHKRGFKQPRLEYMFHMIYTVV